MRGSKLRRFRFVVWVAALGCGSGCAGTLPDHGAGCEGGSPGTARFRDSLQELGGTGQSEAVALGDLDGDGDLDAYVAKQDGNPDVVWFNDGTGHFEDSGQAIGTFDSWDVVLADVDGDGDLDAWVASLGASRTYWNDGTGYFMSNGQVMDHVWCEGGAFGDLDDDGDLDLFAGQAAGSNFQSGDQVWLNDGRGFFEDTGQRLGSPGWTHDIKVGDLDGDGDLDGFSARGGANYVWFNSGWGAFTDSGQRLGTSKTWDVALGDLDGDGDLDVFAANQGDDLAGGGQPNFVWLNDGAGGFTSTGQPLGDAASAGVALGDLDGDGDLDAVVANSAGHRNQVYQNDGTGIFTPVDMHGIRGSRSRDVALGDLDGDCDLDAIIVNDDGPDLVFFNQ